MEKIKNIISLDCRKVGFQSDIYAKTGDVNAIEVVATLTEGAKPIALGDALVRAVFRAVKTDGTKVYNDANIVGNTVICPITSQTIAVPGVVECEIQIIDSSDTEPKTLYSPKFRIIVEDILYKDGGIISTNEYTALTRSIDDVNRVMSEAHKIVEDFSEVTATAEEADNVDADVEINEGVHFSFKIPRGAKGDKPLVEFTLDDEGNLYYEVTYESAE